MKQIDKPISVELSALIIHEAELRDVFELLKKHCKTVELIVNDEMSFNDINELIEKCSGRRIKELDIKTSDPYMRMQRKY